MWQISRYKYEEFLEIRTQLCVTFPWGRKKKKAKVFKIVTEVAMEISQTM